MKILIADDTAENLEAAKKASKNFPEHEFFFTNLARKALKMLKNMDAVITDLFFSDEGHNENDELSEAYQSYCSQIGKGAMFDEVYNYYYKSLGYNSAMRALKDTLLLLQDGTTRKIVENKISHYEKEGYMEWADEQRKKLQNIPAPQFPYGGAIMLKAKELGKSHCLISDIHRHTQNGITAVSAADAMIILLPLVANKVLSFKEVELDGGYDKYNDEDGKDSLFYMGHDKIRMGKDDSVAWDQAIKKILAQNHS